MSSPEPTLVGSYDYRLVTLSVVIAVMASYSALDLAGKVTLSRGIARNVWLGCGAVVMGIGIWSMHYVGMLAFRLPVPVAYDWPTVLLSLLAAIFASAIALFFASQDTLGYFRATVGGVFMGGGIASMHYIGMAAMRLPAMCHYSLPVVLISVILAVLISYVALWLTFHFRENTKSTAWKKILSAMVMGEAIPVMHYTGMAAAHFTASATPQEGWSHALGITSLGTVSIIIATLMVQGFTILTTVVERRFSLQHEELQASENRARQILQTSLDSFVEMDSRERITDWNAQAEATFGWSRAEIAGRALSEMIIPKSHQEIYEQNMRKMRASSAPTPPKLRFETKLSCRDGDSRRNHHVRHAPPRSLLLRDISARPQPAGTGGRKVQGPSGIVVRSDHSGQ